MLCVLRKGVFALIVLAVWAVFLPGLFAQSSTGSLRGQVTDPSGAIIPGAKVSVTGADGTAKTAETSEEGKYSIGGLPPGQYTVRATSKGFAVYENPSVIVTSGRAQTLDIRLVVTMEKQEVTVTETPKVDVSPSNNVGAIVLKGKDLEVLSDNPEELADDLQALAGPAAGPNGGQIYIDGFTGGQLPPKSSIREIRINQNPFSAEYDRLGFGRIEILTKPGTDKFRGQAMFGFGDAVFNSRNPFAPNRPPYQSKRFDGNLSGPLSKKASFFISVEPRDVQEVSVISALTLDPSFNVTHFSQAVLNPQKRTEISPRIDYQLSTNHTLVARYSYDHRSDTNAGLGSFSLPSQAYNADNTEHSLQLTETAVLGPRVVNETRFRTLRQKSSQTANNSQPTIQVLQAFTDGGATLGLVSDKQNHIELQNYTSLTRNAHVLRLGGRLRSVSMTDRSDQNFNGAFTFTSLDAYRITLQGLQNGLTLAQIHAAGGGPSQFSVTGGNALADVSQFDLGVFAQDDWRVRQNFSLNLGLRYETQNNISDHGDFAPRVGFAWGLGSGKARQPKTVIRGGAGIFYDRFSENYTLQALRLNGVTEQRFVIPFPDFFPNAPPLSTLNGNRLPQAIREVEPNLRAPYIVQTAMSLERQLPKNIMLGLTYTHSQGVHMLRSRNINAPLPGTFNPQVPNSGVRPFGDLGNIDAYESSGIFNQNQLIANINARVGPKFTLFGFYVLNKVKSDADGAGSFPANQYDLSGEYSRAAFDVRHRLFMGGSFAAPFGLRFFPFVVASSGVPFNITVGRDLNGDSLFNDRPAFATDLTRPGVVRTAWGAFDTSPIPGQVIIPRNSGNGPGQFSINLRLSKTFGFGERPNSTTQAALPQGGPPGRFGGPGGGPGAGPRGEHGGEGGGHGGPGGFFGDSLPNKRYNLTFSISARNLFNTVNLAPPIGNLSSPLFGQSNALAGGFGPGGANTANRRVELQMRFTF